MRIARTLCVIAAAVACVAASRGKAKMLNGKRVLPIKPFVANELIEVLNLKCWSCQLVEDGTPCTVITGSVVSRLGHDNYTVLVDIDMYEIIQGASHPQLRGTARAVVQRPKPHVPTHFKIVGPAWLIYDGDKKCTTHCIVRPTFSTFRPPKPPDPFR